MSNVEKETVKGTETETQATKKQQAKVTQKQEPEKLGFFGKIKKAIVDNKKVIGAALGGAAVGAAGTLTYGYFADKAAKKRQERETAYVQEEPTNPLDPNV